MLVRPNYPEIKLNLYLEGEIVFEDLNQAEALNIRKQICEQNLSGYYLKVNSPYWYLFDIETNIMDEVAVINTNGEVENWFSAAFKLEGFNDRLYGENLHEAIGIRSAQTKKNKENENIHSETRSGF